ncbi:hypothetical protein [Amycolatopsis pigmentata]|uniref:Ankyrin repeat domain-containing protein n=1 Tax=Amycolatopsis pigmentata TaxID=450801 RepID=A0ABW5G146_9PSEU
MDGFLTPAMAGPHIPVAEWLTRQAELLRDAAEDPVVAEILRFAGMARGTRLDLAEARQAIARDHWYADWADAMAHGQDKVDSGFEAAADAVHAGNLDALRRLLDREPGLITMRSPFPHRQTSLHHVADNGIEVERQLRSPGDAGEVLRLLAGRRARVDALCDSYGGGSGTTTLCLLVSSAVPADAGVQAGLVERIGACGPRLTAELVVEYALIWAAAHGRREVVEFLLTKDPDLRVAEPRFHATALGAARYHGRDEMVALLEPLTPSG